MSDHQVDRQDDGRRLDFVRSTSHFPGYKSRNHSGSGFAVGADSSIVPP